MAIVPALFSLLALSATISAQTWSASQFNSLVAFGDSYTDENRLGYFGDHNGSAPPPGTLLPQSFDTAGGGRTWPRYVVQYTGETSVNGSWSPQMTLYVSVRFESIPQDMLAHKR